MNTSLLICGGNKESRSKKAKEISQELSNPEDIIILDTSLEKGVATTREFISKLNKKPYSSKLLSGIILDANYLTIEAQNTLLKTIEEPNKTSRLLLTTLSEFALLSTIISRCQKIYLKSETSLETKIPEAILSASISDRLDLSEKLDLREWVFYLRELFKQSVTRDTPQPVLMNLVKYIRFVEKINGHQQIANQKLSSYLAVTSIPKNLDTLA